MVLSTRAALSVQTSGRNRPVASAKPATSPLASAVGVSATAATTPLVPIDTVTSPVTAPSPSAAAMLSPVPGPSTAPAAVRPTGAAGAATGGSATSRPNASRSRSVR